MFLNWLHVNLGHALHLHMMRLEWGLSAMFQCHLWCSET